MKQLIVLVLLLSSLSATSQVIHKEKFSTQGKKVLGVWTEPAHIATVYGQMKVVIYDQNGKFYRADIDVEGYIVYSMSKKKVGSTIRYYDNESAFGEYYVITQQGLLKVYDMDGFIATYEKSRL